jgi:hypothetical protein
VIDNIGRVEQREGKERKERTSRVDCRLQVVGGGIGDEDGDGDPGQPPCEAGWVPVTICVGPKEGCGCLSLTSSTFLQYIVRRCEFEVGKGGAEETPMSIIAGLLWKLCR